MATLLDSPAAAEETTRYDGMARRGCPSTVRSEWGPQ